MENNAGDGMVFNAASTVGLRVLNFSNPGTLVGDVADASNHDTIRITSQGHGLKRGDLVYIDEVRGNVVANGTHHVAVAETDLVTSLNLLQTEVPVDDVGPFLLIESPDPVTGQYDFQIRVDDERMQVVGVDESTNVFSVVRGVDSTIAASHLGTSPVYHDSVFLLEGASGSGRDTGVYSGGGRIQLADGAIRGNTFRNNTAGAGVRAELPENTVLLADVADNTVVSKAFCAAGVNHPWSSRRKILMFTISRLRSTSRLPTKSVIEPSGIGTRSELPSSFPSISGITKLVARAAPVEVGTILMAAPLARRRSPCGPSTKLWSPV